MPTTTVGEIQPEHEDRLGDVDKTEWHAEAKNAELGRQQVRFEVVPEKKFLIIWNENLTVLT
jgi:hypothetical protein